MKTLIGSLLITFLVSINANSQNYSQLNHFGRMELLKLMQVDTAEFAVQINNSFNYVKLKNGEKIKESIDTLEKIIIASEIGKNPRAFLPNIVGVYSNSLEMVYKLYLKNNEFAKAKYTLDKLNGIYDENKKFPYVKNVLKPKIIKGMNVEVIGDKFEENSLKFIVDTTNAGVPSLFSKTKQNGATFTINNLKENTLIRMQFSKKTHINKITIYLEKADKEIFHCWTDMRMDKYEIVEDGRVTFEDVSANDFIEINSIYQDTQIKINKISFE